MAVAGDEIYIVPQRLKDDSAMNRLRIADNWPALITAILLLLPLQVLAQSEDDNASLRKQVQALQQALQSVQKRLDVIETDLHSGRLPTAPSVQNPGAGGVGTPQISGPSLTPQRVENWSKLHKGMDPDQVEALLGKPGRHFKLSGQTVWYYHYTGVGSGSVVFARGKNKLLDWQRPPFHAWW